MTMQMVLVACQYDIISQQVNQVNMRPRDSRVPYASLEYGSLFYTQSRNTIAIDVLIFDHY